MITFYFFISGESVLPDRAVHIPVDGDFSHRKRESPMRAHLSFKSELNEDSLIKRCLPVTTAAGFRERERRNLS